MEKSDAPSTRRNRDPILKILTEELINASEILEIGSGTGQHAVYFSENLSHLTWYTSDRLVNHPRINSRVKSYKGSNLKPPINLHIGRNEDDVQLNFDNIFSSNTSHIMSHDNVKRMFKLVGRLLRTDGKFFLYGPFKIGGKFTSKSNEEFNEQLKIQDSLMGLRDIEGLHCLASKSGLGKYEFYEMPTNNYLSVWIKI
ncbi:MAG TPA: DUF938 domain-containing protein [Woeseiaceae bacterium]|nr:DUF938 domain-containing protein [Woeseiaceae bacterium]